MKARENEVSGEIIDAAMKVHTVLGPGLLESNYSEALGMELVDRGRIIQREHRVRASYLGRPLGLAFRVDLIVDRLVIVEVKSVRALTESHTRQLVTYLRHSGLRLGLILNFSEAHMRDGIARIANGMPS